MDERLSWLSWAAAVLSRRSCLESARSKSEAGLSQSSSVQGPHLACSASANRARWTQTFQGRCCTTRDAQEVTRNVQGPWRLPEAISWSIGLWFSRFVLYQATTVLLLGLLLRQRVSRYLSLILRETASDQREVRVYQRSSRQTCFFLHWGSQLMHLQLVDSSHSAIRGGSQCSLWQSDFSNGMLVPHLHLSSTSFFRLKLLVSLLDPSSKCSVALNRSHPNLGSVFIWDMKSCRRTSRSGQGHRVLVLALMGSCLMRRYLAAASYCHLVGRWDGCSIDTSRRCFSSSAHCWPSSRGLH